MENQNPMIRLVIYGRLKKMMMNFLGRKLTSIDKNLLTGIYLRNLKDFRDEVIEVNQNKTLLERLKG